MCLCWYPLSDTELEENFQEYVPDFKKPRRRIFANWMSAGYIYYDEKNYAKQIKLMNDAFIQMKINFKLN